MFFLASRKFWGGFFGRVPREHKNYGSHPRLVLQHRGSRFSFQVLAAQEGRRGCGLSTTIAHAAMRLCFWNFLATPLFYSPCFPIDLISSVKLASRDCYNHPPRQVKKRYLLKWLKKAGRRQVPGFIQEKYCRELYRSIVPPAPVCRCV